MVDCFGGELVECLRYLSKAGLSDVYCVLNRPGFLSEGQKWRFRLAMAMARGGEFLFCDEFCSSLDRITACVIAHNVRRFADSSGMVFVLASSHDDIICDLRPDVVVTRYLSGEAEVVYKDGERSN